MTSLVRSRQARPASPRPTRSAGLVLLRGLALAVGQRLADLAVVAVDRGRLEAELPRLEVDVLDLLDRGALGQVDRLGDRAGQERLGGRHHPDVAHRLQGAGTHRGVEDLVVLGLQTGRVDHVAVLGDEGDDRLDLLLVVPEVLQRPRDGLVDDLHRAAADQLLELHQREVGLDAGGVAVHHEADGAGRREHRGLRVAEAVGLAELDHVGPGLGREACGPARRRRGRVRTVSLAAWCLRITRLWASALRA